MKRFQNHRFELLVVIPGGRRPEEMEKDLAPYFAHFARDKSKRRKSYKLDAQGRYTLVATRPDCLREIHGVLEQFAAESITLGAHLPHPHSPGETVFVSLFTVAAKL